MDLHGPGELSTKSAMAIIRKSCVKKYPLPYIDEIDLNKHSPICFVDHRDFTERQIKIRDEIELCHQTDMLKGYDDMITPSGEINSQEQTLKDIAGGLFGSDDVDDPDNINSIKRKDAMGYTPVCDKTHE